MPTPKKPTALHVLNGNPSKIKDLGKDEPKPEKIAPTPPLWLDEVARQEWEELAPKMVKIGLLTEVDKIVFSNLCQEVSDSLKYRKVIAEEGATYEHTNTKGQTNMVTRPEAILLYKSQQMIKAYCQELGLTPSARGRMQIQGIDEKEDKITEMMRKKRSK